MRRYWFIFPPIGIAIVALVSAVVMWLWNALLPPLLNVSTISFWQALGILVLSRILFGGFHHRGPRDHGHFMHNRWSKLCDEEREKIKHDWQTHCGCRETTEQQPSQTS
jgi:hypothetical protein